MEQLGKAMTIVQREAKGTFEVWCDGCGWMLSFKTTNRALAELAVDRRKWLTTAFDYGYGLGYEHFCSPECFDPPEFESLA